MKNLDLSNPDMMMLAQSMLYDGHISDDYQDSLKDVDLYFDKEIYWTPEVIYSKRKCILILSVEKLKKEWIGIDKKYNLKDMDSRISMEEMKEHLSECAKLGIDGIIWVVKKMLERHEIKIKDKQSQLKLF